MLVTSYFQIIFKVKNLSIFESSARHIIYSVGLLLPSSYGGCFEKSEIIEQGHSVFSDIHCTKGY